MSKETSWLRKSQTLNTVGESSNNVVTIVKQLINSIKKRLHTKKVITSPLFIYSSREIFCYKYRIWKIPIELYAYQNVCCSVTPTATMASHRPHPKNERKKWRTRWYFFLSFGFTVYNSLFNSQCYIKSTAHTAKKLSSYPTCRTERTGVYVLVREIFQETCLA